MNHGLRQASVTSVMRRSLATTLTSIVAVTSIVLMAGSGALAQGRDVYATQGGRGAPGGDVFNSNGNPYGGPHPSRRTGKQAIQDDSIYCQQDPQGNVIPKPYGGTRRNIPCGPNFGPQRQPQQPPAASRRCPMKAASAGVPDRPAPAFAATMPWTTDLVARAGDEPRVHPVQRSRGWEVGLYVGGRNVLVENEASLPALNGVQREIFLAMACNPSRRFEFASSGELMQNIRVREAIIAVMDDVRLNRLSLEFNGHEFRMPRSGWHDAYDNPAGAVLTNRGPLTWESNAGRSASSAMRLFLQRRTPAGGTNGPDFMVECLSGMQMVVLGGVYRALGDAEFDRWHPVDRSPRSGAALYGIGVPIVEDGLPALGESSVKKHLAPVRTENPRRRQEKILVRDMVPGDYVYLANVPDYAELYKNGAWAGENAIYMGNSEFYGLGIGARRMLANELMAQMLEAYNSGLPLWRKSRPGRPDELRFTLIASPVVSRTPGNAGGYVR